VILSGDCVNVVKGFCGKWIVIISGVCVNFVVGGAAGDGQGTGNRAPT
jgi:hypothetical protein